MKYGRTVSLYLMEFPNPKAAVVDISKLEDYCLSPDHPRGKNKARVFLSVLGIGQSDAAELRRLILAAIADADCEPGISDIYGTRFHADLSISFKNRIGLIRTTWMVRASEDFPRLTTCYLT